MTDPPNVTRVLEFWFGELDDQGRADAAHSRRWWIKDPEFDERIRRDFGAEHRAVVSGEREDWLKTPRGRLAYVIVLDQFSRNMFRGTPDMFAHDAQALRAALEGVDQGTDRRLRTDERVFLYLPLMHSEQLELQERCVQLFSALVDELSGEAKAAIQYNLDFAVRHRDIVARFGRFPHRNALLGRASTEAEIRFLSEPNSSF